MNQGHNNISFIDKNSCIMSELDNLSRIMGVGDISDVSSPQNLTMALGAINTHQE
jgi:hypothetical protein